jgi:uncharacterized protein (TIGR00255 family)
MGKSTTSILRIQNNAKNVIIAIIIDCFLNETKKTNFANKIMIKSMTGYGKDSIFFEDKSIQIEIRSVNSKNFDFSSRVPNHYKLKEPEIRSLLQKKLVRGKIEFSILELGSDVSTYKINIPVFKKHFLSISKLAEDLNLADSGHLFSSILKIPDVLSPDESELNEETWLAVIHSIDRAALLLDKFRVDEGENLFKDFLLRTTNIKSLLNEISQFEEDRIEILKKRIFKNLEEISKTHKIDENRLEQELIFYLEKLDITEEKVRLTQHLNYFEEVLNEEVSQGKKLGFITQEIGRELNTMGSKANHALIQQYVVKMKDELEKIKEQLLNIL